MIELAQQSPDLTTNGVAQGSLSSLQRPLRAQGDGEFARSGAKA
ncbi:MAG: hypothetical protein AAFY20_22210 [Cyanobacteria bacterium J06639_14]